MSLSAPKQQLSAASDRKASCKFHPRMCGEHLRHTWATWQYCGSSPRVRGTRYRPGGSRPGERFIPACAGNTWVKPYRKPPRPVHPRVCGEHPTTPLSGSGFCGSPPRVRGTRPPERGYDGNRGFIPACAGNTKPLTFRTSRSWVHPRVCGEHSSC